ncbi:MAG: putative Chloramphenicol resistance protein permease of the major facilitator superfamily [Nocardioidaceae bacterium]|nr:putative Chloramphenicol resistance protein permease of the major facilitator superfamily [Nocardioidaceae bacterium]
MASGTSLIAVSYGVVRYGYGLQLPQLAGEFSLSPRTAGAIASGSFVAYCAAALAAQRLIAWRGARAVLWLAAALAASGALLVAVSSSTPMLALGVLVAGSSAGAASPALVVAVGCTVREPLVARAQAVVNAGTGVGVAIAGAATLAAPQAWRLVWACGAAVALLAAATVDRHAYWPTNRRRTGAGEPHGSAGPGRTLLRPALAAAVAGTGSAAVWTFGRDLITDTGGLPERTTAALWCLLGTAAVLGAFSGDAVRLLGIRRAWALTATLTATGTAMLALAPGQVLTAAIAGAVFGGAYTALSGVLIAWASVLRPHAAGQATATLFIALTAGQAVGAVATGVVAERAGAPAAFWAGAALILTAATILPRRVNPGATSAGSHRRRGLDVIPAEQGTVRGRRLT